MARPHRIVPGPGRPSTYRQHLADEICRGMAGGKCSTEVCQSLGLPPSTVGEWRAAHPEFRTAYVEAFRARAYGMGEEALMVLNDVPRGADMATVTLARAKSDLLKFLASRLVPALAETGQPQLNASVVNVYLPAKGAEHDGARLIEGSATEVLEDQSEG